jgi:type I restriction enzyme S subunit
MSAQEIKPGLKKTEVGVIPEDWQETLLDAVAKRGSGHTPDKKCPNYWGGDIKWISLQDTARLDHLYIFDTAEKITAAGIANSSAKLHPPGTVVLSRDAGVGKSAIMNDAMAVSQHFMAWSCSDSINNVFLYYWLQSNKAEFERIAMGNTIKTIGLAYFKNLNVPLPSKAEQEAIAGALGDADALIDALEHLLAKKCNLKQGAMQDLLTGKRRLSGFKGRWTTKRLADVAHIKTGSRNNEDKVEDGEYPLFVRSATVERINEFSYDCEAILVPGEGGIGSIFHYIFGRFDVHQRVYAITHFSDQVAGKYIYFYMIEHFGSYAMENSVKATVDSLRLPTFQNFDVALPPTLDEQTAIAETLSDMDAEIALLEQKLAKARAVKQGMMQELLTGRTRFL